MLPDGRIVWSSNRGGNFEIWIAGPDGTAPHQLSRDGALAENPSASPDGRWVVYNSRASEKPGLWKISPDGGPAELLVSGTTRLPEVSPDGRYVLYLSNIRLERLSFKIASLETGEILPFEVDVSSEGGRARWLPDGSAFAFTAAGRPAVTWASSFAPSIQPARRRKPSPAPSSSSAPAPPSSPSPSPPTAAASPSPNGGPKSPPSCSPNRRPGSESSREGKVKGPQRLTRERM